MNNLKVRCGIMNKVYDSGLWESLSYNQKKALEMLIIGKVVKCKK